MRTIYKLAAPTPRSFFSLFSAALLTLSLVCLPPRARAENPRSLPTTSPAPFYGTFGLGQASYPSAQTVSLSSPARLDMYSVTPETLGDLMMIHQRYLAAIEAYQRAPHDSAVIWNKLGIAYQHMYALDIAKLQYEKALSLDPHYAEAINNLGTVYYGQQNYHKAEIYYKRAIRMKPDCASFYSNLGTAYFADRNYKHGVQAYRKAFSLDPEVFIADSIEQVAEMGPAEEQVTLNYALAQMYAQAGMVDAAIHYLRMSFMDGFDDTKKLLDDKSFAALRTTQQFRLLMTEEHIKDTNATDRASAGRPKSPLR